MRHTESQLRFWLGPQEGVLNHSLGDRCPLHSVPRPLPPAAFYICYLPHPGSFLPLSPSISGEAPAGPLLQAHPQLQLPKQAKANNLRQLARISPMDSSAQTPELYHSRDSLCKGVSREVTQVLVMKHSCRRARGSFLEGQIPKLASPHSSDSLAGLPVPVPAFSHRFFSY